MSKLLGTLMMIGALVALSSGSAIPMWEFLSRGEKMSHLYSMFAKQVSAHCKSTANELPVALCKRDLLVYGIGRLERMSDVHLDAMDPYQRGVNDLIWDSMVEGHASRPAKQRHQHQHAATDAPIREPTGPYERNPLFDDAPINIHHSSSKSGSSRFSNDRLNEASSSAVLVSASGSDASAASVAAPTNYAMDMDAMYEASPYHSEQQSTNHNYQQLMPESSNQLAAHAAIAGSRFLTGPMIVRVRPDGTPVDEERPALPRDDDREAMTIGRVKLPTVQQIASEFDAATSSASSSASSSYRTASRTH